MQVRFLTMESGHKRIILKVYVDRVKEDQNGIYCSMGVSITAV